MPNPLVRLVTVGRKKEVHKSVSPRLGRNSSIILGGAAQLITLSMGLTTTRQKYSRRPQMRWAMHEPP